MLVVITVMLSAVVWLIAFYLIGLASRAIRS
jgi:hypothetical protein